MDRPMASPALVRLFLGLQLTGAIGMIITLCTAILSRQVKRNATWYAFCVSWVVSCASYCLLFFAGAQFGPEPSHPLCVTQASLAYAAPALSVKFVFTPRAETDFFPIGLLGLLWHSSLR